MKVPIDEVAAIDLDAPVLSAYEARIKGGHDDGSCGASTAGNGTATGRLKGIGKRTAWTKAARTGNLQLGVCRENGQGLVMDEGKVPRWRFTFSFDRGRDDGDAGRKRPHGTFGRFTG